MTHKETGVSRVIFKAVTEPSLEGVNEAVEAVFTEAGLGADSLGSSCFIKINAMSRLLIPGANTSPWVLCGVLRHLREANQRMQIVIGDSDVAGRPQFEKACGNWGYREAALRYRAELVNLSHCELKRVETGNHAIPSLEYPAMLDTFDSIINLPVLKTHVLSGITCCLKNYWGMLPRTRYQYHTHVSEVISEINMNLVDSTFNIVDGTVCMEGSGPKTGTPKECSVLIAGTDRVAVDSAVLAFMGFSPDVAPQVGLSEEKGVGSTWYDIAGDSFRVEPFEPPSQGMDLVSFLENRIRNIPVIGHHFYHPRIASVLGFVGTVYNEVVWYRLRGRKLLRAAVEESDYSRMYGELLGKR